MAQHFTEQGFIEVLNKRLSVSNTPRKSPRKITPVTTDDVSVMSTTVEISGISVTTSEDYLRMYFESEKRSGGGELNHLQYSQAEGTATITFHDHTGNRDVSTWMGNISRTATVIHNFDRVGCNIHCESKNWTLFHLSVTFENTVRF